MGIYVYEPNFGSPVDFGEVVAYLGRTLEDVQVEGRLPFIEFFMDRWSPSERAARLEEFAWGRARARVTKLASPWWPEKPLPAEVAYELKLLNEGSQGRASSGLMYDGFEALALFREQLPHVEARRGYLHVILTDLLLGTWDVGTGRYHARVAVYGNPSLISLPGLVEAPAKPRDFYLDGKVTAVLGDTVFSDLKRRYRDRVLDFDDERLAEVLKGYVMQAVFYHLSGDPFCEDPYCRLYNAHWQEEVLKAQQSAPYELCPRHERFLAHMSEGERSRLKGERAGWPGRD